MQDHIKNDVEVQKEAERDQGIIDDVHSKTCIVILTMKIIVKMIYLISL